MEVALLGPLLVTVGGTSVRLGSAKERAVLSLLALRGDKGCTAAELIGALWGDEPPASAIKTVQTYVSNLRRKLPARAIGTTSNGYALAVRPEAVDVHRFESAVAQARRLIGGRDLAAALGVLSEAQNLWRGPALMDLVDQPAGMADAARLEEIRRGAAEDLGELRLALGQHHAVLADLEAAVAAEPLRERRWQQLMLALYRCGRQADALRACSRLRQYLADELGITPGAEVADMEQRILLQKPDLDWCEPSGPTDTSADNLTSRPQPSALASIGEPAGTFPSALARASRRPLIGRRAELDRLDFALARVASGAGVVLLVGQPGVGKTRLAAAAARQAADLGALVLFGRCDEGLRAPYQPFVEALTAYIAAVPTETLIGQLGLTGHELVRLIPGLAGRVAGLRPPTAAAPETERWLLFEAAAQFMRAVAGDRRTMVVIDDLHWAEPATLMLLRHLARAGIDGLLVVATARPAGHAEPDDFAEALADLARHHVIETVTVGELSGDDVAALVAARVDRTPSDAFAGAVHRATGGNAFFVHELLSHLCDTGVLTGSDGLWPSELQIEQSGAPAGVRHVVKQRVGQLSPAARAALMVAAVAGDEFNGVEVAMAAGDGPEVVITALEEAAASGLIVETSQTAGDYRFTHALVRHNIYDNISALRRAQLHCRVGDAIRTSTRPHIEPRLSELAYHYYQGLDAGDPFVALGYLHEAGDRAVRQAAFEEAIEHYRGALAALERGPDDPGLRYQLLAGLAESATALSDNALSHQTWAAAAAIALTAKDPSRFFAAIRGYRGIETLEVEDQILTRLIDAGLELAGPGDSVERAQLLTWQALSRYSQPGREESVRDALAMTERLNDRPAEFTVLSSLAHLLLGSSRAEERLAMDERALQLVEDQGWERERAWIYRNIAQASIQLGRRAEAEAALERAERISRTGGRRLELNMVLTIKAAIAIAEGRFAEAKPLAAHSRDVGDPRNLAVALAYQSQISAIRVEQGRADGVIDGLQTFARHGPPRTAAWRAMLAALCAEVGRRADAGEVFEALAPDGFGIIDRDWAFPLAVRYLAELCTHFDDAERAVQLLPEVEAYRGQLLVVTIGTSIEAAADRSLGQLYGVLGRYREAIQHFEAASRLEDSMGFAPLAARTRYWHARLLAQSGNADDHRMALALLVATESTSTALGMTLLAHQASALQRQLLDVNTTQRVGLGDLE